MSTDEELVKSVRRKLKLGYPDGELKNELLEKGHTEADIEKLFFIASGHSVKPTKVETIRNSNTTTFNVIGVALLITGITIMSAQTWLKEYGVYLLMASGLCFAIGFAKAASGKSKENL